MNLIKLTNDYKTLVIKYAQDTAAAQKTFYNQIILLNKKANELWNVIAKSAYNDQIKNYVKNIANMAGILATKAYKNGILKTDSATSYQAINSIVTTLKSSLIHTGTLKPFDDLISALSTWAPVDLPAQDPNAAKPETTNPQNVNQNTPTPQTTSTSIAPTSPSGIAGI